MRRVAAPITIDQNLRTALNDVDQRYIITWQVPGEEGEHPESFLYTHTGTQQIAAPAPGWQNLLGRTITKRVLTFDKIQGQPAASSIPDFVARPHSLSMALSWDDYRFLTLHYLVPPEIWNTGPLNLISIKLVPSPKSAHHSFGSIQYWKRKAATKKNWNSKVVDRFYGLYSHINHKQSASFTFK